VRDLADRLVMLNHMVRAATGLVTGRGLHTYICNDSAGIEHGLAPGQLYPYTLLRLLTIAGVGADDTVVDLGSGDGVFTISAALLTGCRSYGVECVAGRFANSLAVLRLMCLALKSAGIGEDNAPTAAGAGAACSSNSSSAGTGSALLSIEAAAPHAAASLLLAAAATGALAPPQAATGAWHAMNPAAAAPFTAIAASQHVADATASSRAASASTELDSSEIDSPIELSSDSESSVSPAVELAASTPSDSAGPSVRVIGLRQTFDFLRSYWRGRSEAAAAGPRVPLDAGAALAAAASEWASMPLLNPLRRLHPEPFSTRTADDKPLEVSMSAAPGGVLPDRPAGSSAREVCFPRWVWGLVARADGTCPACPLVGM